jgi:hypothetical protein
MEPIRRLLPAVLVVLVPFGVGACAGGDGAADRAGAPATTSAAAPTTASPTASPGGSGATTRPPGSTRAPATPRRVDPSARLDLPRTADPKLGVRETLTGTVVAGAEEGCLLLDGYLLLNAPTDVVREGARVRVTGQIRTDLVSTCQQGTPLMVESARPA